MMAEAMAHTNTAPAAMSFTCPAMGWRVGETKSTNFSVALLHYSATITKPIQPTTTIHSMRVMPKKKPAHTTTVVAMR